TSAAPVDRSDWRAKPTRLCVANANPQLRGGDVPQPAGAARSAEQPPSRQDVGRCSNTRDFFALRLSDVVRAHHALLPVASECCHSVFGRGLQNRSAFERCSFPASKLPLPSRSASPSPGALHPRCPGARGQVLRVRRANALAPPSYSRIALPAPHPPAQLPPN